MWDKNAQTYSVLSSPTGLYLDVAVRGTIKVHRDQDLGRHNIATSTALVAAPEWRLHVNERVLSVHKFMLCEFQMFYETTFWCCAAAGMHSITLMYEQRA